jgi:hypothetical protein
MPFVITMTRVRSRIVPIHFPHAGRHMADIVPRSRKIFREAQWGIVLKELPCLQRYVDVLHMSFAVAISKNSKTFRMLIGSSSIGGRCHYVLETKLQRDELSKIQFGEALLN